jgi:flagellar biosynthetic protein FliS
MSPTELAYRKTAVAGASGFGLLIALYDTLAGDLRRAASAERANDVEKRCKEANHALLVISHLEDAIDRGNGGELAQRLRAFYSYLRRKTIEAQASRSPEILEEEMARILEIRAVWQKAEMGGTTPTAHVPGWVQPPAYPGTSLPVWERNSSRWSA